MKHAGLANRCRRGVKFSPALSGGLIEARLTPSQAEVVEDVFPRVKRGPH